MCNPLKAVKKKKEEKNSLLLVLRCIILWSDKIDAVILIFQDLLIFVCIPKMWPILEKLLWAVAVYSLEFGGISCRLLFSPFDVSSFNYVFLFMFLSR